MKNQYFGDINDYRKYGLLRALTGHGQINTAVCWMLTPDDGRMDGSRTTYLSRPAEWRYRDPQLFDHLELVVLRSGVRNVVEIETSGILASCTFISDMVPDDGVARGLYFQRAMDLARGCDLVFFDPDNGIEVKSKPYGRKDSSKYLYWHEIDRFWKAGHSLLIYQHFPRVKRDPFIGGKARQLIDKTSADEVFFFRTSHVVFFLVPQAEHTYLFRDRNEEVERVWGKEIEVDNHCR
ncbi:MAG TPA: hypothetical protein VM075_00055 [Anaerolineae bacterium]|nr:hypothetical protein [Anaerolineae bacterium]